MSCFSPLPRWFQGKNPRQPLPRSPQHCLPGLHKKRQMPGALEMCSNKLVVAFWWQFVHRYTMIMIIYNFIYRDIQHNYNVDVVTWCRYISGIDYWGLLMYDWSFESALKFSSCTKFHPSTAECGTVRRQVAEVRQMLTGRVIESGSWFMPHVRQKFLHIWDTSEVLHGRIITLLKEMLEKTFPVLQVWIRERV